MVLLLGIAAQNALRSRHPQFGQRSLYGLVVGGWVQQSLLNPDNIVEGTALRRHTHQASVCTHKGVFAHSGNPQNGNTQQLTLWDVAGQERFTNMIRTYFKNAKGAIIVFDSLRVLPTLNAAAKWKLEVDCCFPDDENIPTVLLANKMLDNFIKENNIKKWFFTSAKEGTGLEEADTDSFKITLNSTNAKNDKVAKKPCCLS
eukprot:gene3954-4579_t